MDTIDILDRIEEIIKNNDLEPDEHDEKKSQNPVKEFVYLILSFFINILKTPFKLVAKYITNELVKAVKKDAKLYAFIMGLMGVMFVFFSVLWLFISFAVGIYFYDKGNTIFISVLYSIAFQIISFIVVAIIAIIAMKSIKSLKLLVEISKK